MASWIFQCDPERFDVDDPLLRGMLIMRQAAGTNFPLEPHEAARLAYMWSRVGLDWTRDESLAGLWAYLRTTGGEVSKKVGSPVSDVSVLTGRSVPGVYNKVMNFRAIDPTDGRTGMKGGGAVDREVWDAFYDPALKALDKVAIETEFDAIWMPGKGIQQVPDQKSVQAATEREVARLLDRSLEELLAAYEAGKKATSAGLKKPGRRKKVARTTVHMRDPLVIAIARKRAKNCCEVPACIHPQFLDDEGLAYCEVHHVIPLAENGPDSIENAVCLCPAHHREAHYGKDASKLAQTLKAVRSAAAP